MQLESQKHQILIDTVVVNLVPMEIEDIEESLKPKSLSSHSLLLVFLADLSEELSYLLGNIMLVRSLVRMPEGYEMPSNKSPYQRIAPPI